MEMASCTTNMPPRRNLLPIYYYSLSLFRCLHEDLRNAYYIDFAEGCSLANILMRHTGLSTFEYDLLLFFNQRYPTGYDAESDVGIPKLLDALAEVMVPSNRLSRVMEELQQNMPVEHNTLFKEFSVNIDRMAHTINWQMDKVTLAKRYRALLLTSIVRDMQHCIPEHVLEIIFLLIHTNFNFKRGGPRYYPDKLQPEGPLTVLKDEAATKAEEFLAMVNDAYLKWERQNLDPILFYFRDLPQIFIDVLLGYRALISYAQKFILNEYCRTTALLISLTNFQETRKSISRYEDMRTTIGTLKEILKDSFQCIQGPKLVPFMNSTCLWNHRGFFITDMQEKFKAAHESLFDYRENVPCRSHFFHALKRCSFEKNFNVNLLNPFHELGHSYYQIQKSLELYRVPDEYCFNINFNCEETFFEEKDCLVLLPLMCSRAISLFLTSPEDESAIFSPLPMQNKVPGSPPSRPSESCDENSTPESAVCTDELTSLLNEVDETVPSAQENSSSDVNNLCHTGSTEEKSDLINAGPDSPGTNSRPSESCYENSAHESETEKVTVLVKEKGDTARLIITKETVVVRENSSSDINNLCHTASTEKKVEKKFNITVRRKGVAQEKSSTDINNLSYTKSTGDNNQSINKQNFTPADFGYELADIDPNIAQPDACEEKDESSFSDDEFVLVPETSASHPPEMSPGKDAPITKNETSSSAD